MTAVAGLPVESKVLHGGTNRVTKHNTKMGQVLVVHLQQSGLQPCSRGDSTDAVLNSADAVLNRHLKNSLMDIASRLSDNQLLRFSEPASYICFPFRLTLCLRFWNRGIAQKMMTTWSCPSGKVRCWICCKTLN